MFLSLIAGLLIAVLAGLGMVGLDRLGFYLIIVVPLFAGALVGMAVAIPAIRRRASIPPQIVVAILCGAVTLGVYWYGSYMTYVEDWVGQVQRATPSATREEATAFLNEVLVQEYGASGFQGFLADYAAAGLTISRALSSTSGIELKDGLAYAFWAVEGLVLIGMAVAMVLRRDGMAKALQPKTDTGGPASPIR
ncbi:MAG: hypothetical protein L6Q98_01825 [Anaerolineae bacterium]|nr:hypothetical protein [Anaerolineae bacterium]NUQ05167.1 hypothetical protein [Anaerolineae bacterium]